jgi:hypothetical protein
MQKLHCNHTYTNGARKLYFDAGHHYDVSDEVASFLFADSPGSFTVVKPVKPAQPEQPVPPFVPGVIPEPSAIETKEIEFPPRDTAMKKATRSKRASSGE